MKNSKLYPIRQCQRKFLKKETEAEHYNCVQIRRALMRVELILYNTNVGSLNHSGSNRDKRMPQRFQQACTYTFRQQTNQKAGLFIVPWNTR